MRYLRGIIAWIDSLTSGSQFRSWAIILLKILGLAVFVGISVWSIVICVDTIGASKNLGMTPSILVVIGSILEVCIIITITTAFAMLCWNRSNKIRTLDNDPNFLLISIAVIGVQLLGEVSFLILIGDRCSNIGGFNLRIGNSEVLRCYHSESGTLEPLSHRSERKYHFYLKCDFVCDFCSFWTSAINYCLFHSRRD